MATLNWSLRVTGIGSRVYRAEPDGGFGNPQLRLHAAPAHILHPAYTLHRI